MSPKDIIFVDSDVIVSSLLSTTGAAYLLLEKTNLTLFISNLSLKELKIVCKRLAISEKELDRLVKTRLKIVNLSQRNALKRNFGGYVNDVNDNHIVAGAKIAKARFLISYNTKHFKTDLIKKDFGIILYKPATLLQYLRSS